MNKLHYYFTIGLLFSLLFANAAFCQSEEMDKLKKLIEKGNFEKAQAYCDKVTAPMSEKSAAKIFALMANAYYHNSDYIKSAEMVEKSADFKLALKLAKEFSNSANECYDVKTAIRLFKKGKEPERAAELLFGEGQYEEAAKTNSLASQNMKYGDSLFNQGKIDESLYFFKRAKAKGKKFNNEKVLNYYFGKKDYQTVYIIQDFAENGFSMPVQGSVIDKMMEFNESQAFIKHFIDSIAISKNKQDEVFVEAFINNKKFDQAFDYCMQLKNPEQQIALSFLADKTTYKYPDVSAYANIKLGRNMVVQDLLTNYLIQSAKEFNDKWTTEPIDKKLIAEYSKKTMSSIKKCEKNYCELLSLASKTSTFKADDLVKKDKNQSAEYGRTSVFMKLVLGANCK